MTLQLETKEQNMDQSGTNIQEKNHDEKLKQSPASTTPPCLVKALPPPPCLARPTCLATHPCIATHPYLAEQVRAISQLISAGPPSVYKVPLHKVLCMNDRHIAIYDVGTRRVQTPAPERVLMLLGVNGSGIMNWLTNQIFGVCRNDAFRFVLEDGKDEQSSWIRAFTFHRTRGSPLPFTLTVVYILWYENICKVLPSRKLGTAIRDLFSTPGPPQINLLHGIMLTTMPVQGQVVEVVRSTFGVHKTSNMFIGISGDIIDLSMEGAIEWGGVRSDKVSTYDCSVLFKSFGDQNNAQDCPLWEGEAKSFEKLIKNIGKMEGCSLLLSDDKLIELKTSELSLKNLECQIHAKLVEMSALHQLYEVEGTFEGQRDAMGKSVYQFTICYSEVPLTRGQMVVNCTECKVTCHFPCLTSVSECCVMGEDTTCTMCRCPASNHITSAHKYQISGQQVTQTGVDLRRQFQFSGIVGDLDLKKAVSLQLAYIQHSVVELIVQAYSCLRYLDVVASKVNPINPSEYMDLLVQSEKQEASSCYEICIKYLELMRGEVCMLSDEEVRRTEKLAKEEEDEKGNERGVASTMAELTLLLCTSGNYPDM